MLNKVFRVNQATRHFSDNKTTYRHNRLEAKYKYLDNLIKYSELCLTGANRAPSYGTDLSNLCLEILGKESHVWHQEFDVYKDDFNDLIELDQKIEYFLQNCLLIIENSKQVQKIILMSLTQLSCIDYPKDHNHVQTLGYRCVTILKNILSKGSDLKDLVEKSILEIIIQNIKIENWLMISEIQVSGVISFLEVPNIANLFILDEEIFPLMHKWISQITDFIGDKRQCYELDDDDHDDAPNQDKLQEKMSKSLVFSRNFHKAHQILKLINMCMQNRHLIIKFVQDGSDRNYLLKMYYNFLHSIKMDFLKFIYQGQEYIYFYEFQITMLSLIENFNIVLEDRHSDEKRSKLSTSSVLTTTSLAKFNGLQTSIMNLQEVESGIISMIKLSDEEVEKYLNFSLKHIQGQIGYEFKSFNNTKFYESMEQLISNVKDDSKNLEKSKKMTVLRHFAQVIQTAGSFQTLIKSQKITGKNDKDSEYSLQTKILSKFLKVYQMQMLDPLILSACCKFIQYHLKYHTFSSEETLKQFLNDISNCVNLLQYLDLDGKVFDDLIQLGQLHLSHEIFFKHFSAEPVEMQDEEDFEETMINNPVVMKAIYDILDLFNFFYIRSANNDIKIKKALKNMPNSGQITKKIKKDVREQLDQKQRKGILLKLLELNDVNIRVQACRQLLSLKTIKGEKSGQLNWTLNDLQQLLGRLFDLYSAQKGGKKEQDISFIILIFCKFYTEVDPLYVEEVISELGLYQYDTMIEILEDALQLSYSNNEAQAQNQNDLCLSTVFLMKKLLQNLSIREQTSKEANFRRIKNCINYEGENFDETFPPLCVEDLCQNIGIILECFEARGVYNDSLLAFRLIKKLGDILEGVVYKTAEVPQQQEEPQNNVNQTVAKAGSEFLLNLQKSPSGPRSRQQSIIQSTPFLSNQKQVVNESAKLENIIKQLKSIKQHSISITSDSDNSISSLTSDLIKNLESQKKNAIQAQQQEKKQLGKIQGNQTGGTDKNIKNKLKSVLESPAMMQRKVSIEQNALGMKIQQLQDNDEEKEGGPNSIKDFKSIRSLSRFHLINLIKEECSLWDQKKKVVIDPSAHTLFSIQHNLFSSQQGLTRILGFLQPDQRYLIITSKANLINDILKPREFQPKVEQKEPQKTQEFSKQVNDILLMGSKHSQLDEDEINAFNFELFDSDDYTISYNHMFYNLVTNVNDVYLLKMFIKPKAALNTNPQEIKHRQSITEKNKKAIILSGFLRCIYLSIKKAPNNEIKESAINQAKNIQTFNKIAILCKENGFIKGSLGCKFLTISRLIFKHYQGMSIPELQEVGPGKQQHMKQYLANESMMSNLEDSQFETWSINEEIELYIATLSSIQEMVELLFQGIFKFKILQKSDIILLREIVKTIKTILIKIPSLSPVYEIFKNNTTFIKSQQKEHPSQNLYPHREHIAFIVQNLFSSEMINNLSFILLYPYQKLNSENRKALNETTSIFIDLFGTYFSLSQQDYHRAVCTINSSLLIISFRLKKQVNQAFIQQLMQCCYESNLSTNLIDALYVKDLLISTEREILYCWSWVYVRKDEEKDNSYEKKLLLLTNCGVYIIDVQLGNKCNQCHLGSLCTEKYKVEHVFLLTNSAAGADADNRQKQSSAQNINTFSQGFSNQQIRITSSLKQQNLFSQKQVLSTNMIIIFSTLEKGREFYRLLNKLIPKKNSTTDTFLSFIYSCLFCNQQNLFDCVKHVFFFIKKIATEGIAKLKLEGDQQAAQMNTFEQNRRNSGDTNFDEKEVKADSNSSKGESIQQFFVVHQEGSLLGNLKNLKLSQKELMVLATDSKYPDEILLIKEKPTVMFRQQQQYDKLLQYYYFKNHLQTMKDIISKDNINYSAIAHELEIINDKLFDSVHLCFDIQRINIKCFAKLEFPNGSESQVIINVSPNYSDTHLEKNTKISKTKIKVIDKDDDYVDIQYHSKINHLSTSSLQIQFTSELSRQQIRLIVNQSVNPDSFNEKEKKQQYSEEYSSQLKNLIRQQSVDTPLNRKQINKKNTTLNITKRFTKLKDAISSKIIPKIKNYSTLQNIKEDVDDDDLNDSKAEKQDDGEQDLNVD